MNLLLSMLACFLAIQVGALVICLAMMVMEQGPVGAVEGVGVWIIGQMMIFPIALIAMPFGVLVRFILGELFESPRKVALITGAVIGPTCAIVVWSISKGAALPDAIVWSGIGGFAGMAGGWTWWRVERRHFDGIRN